MQTAKKIKNGTSIMKVQIGGNLIQSEKLALLTPEELQLKRKFEEKLFFEYLNFLQLPGNKTAYKATMIGEINDGIMKVFSLAHREITCKDEIIDYILNLYHSSKILTGLFMKHGLFESFLSYKIERANHG